jgi:hypothetical protein
MRNFTIDYVVPALFPLLGWLAYEIIKAIRAHVTNMHVGAALDRVENALLDAVQGLGLQKLQDLNTAVATGPVPAEIVSAVVAEAQKILGPTAVGALVTHYTSNAAVEAMLASKTVALVNGMVAEATQRIDAIKPVSSPAPVAAPAT